MIKAYPYFRVSTENQEAEGTSLQTQEESCLCYCNNKGYGVSQCFSDTYSGLSLDRPKLNELRELIRHGQIDVVVVHSLDRLSRDPVHGVILIEEMEKYGVRLEAVTETVDSSEIGKLISYIRGFASKLEAQKIRERTMRGRKARAQSGKLPANGHLYGYTYIRGKGQGEGVRYIDEDQAQWVREIFRMLVEEGLSADQITYRLRELAVKTPSGNGWWSGSTVGKILKNPAYYGKTFVFTQSKSEPGFKVKSRTKVENTGVVWKPRDEWLEIPEATPAIISEELFNEAQQCLDKNKRLSLRNNKHDYLLRGIISCARCGRTYTGEQGIKIRRGKRYHYPYYGCQGKKKRVTPILCDNKQHATKQIEDLVWSEVEKVLSQPDILLSELEKARECQAGTVLETELDRFNSLLDNRTKQKNRIWKAFEITGDEAKFKSEISEIDRDIKGLEVQISDTERQIAVNDQTVLNARSIEETCVALSKKIHSLDFEDKRLALEALNIRVLVDGDNVTVIGAIPVEVSRTANTLSEWHYPGRCRLPASSGEYSLSQVL